MKYKLIIDKDAEEEIIAIVHAPTSLTQQIENLVFSFSGADSIMGYRDDEMRKLEFGDIECITVLEGKTYAIDSHNKRYRLKQRLYELEKLLPSSFIRINQSALANENRLAQFRTTFRGAVDAVFKCGYTEYVSRRCFAEIKRRFDKK